MQQNVGPLDQTLRVGLGFALMFIGFLLPAPLSTVAYVGFLVFATTGFSGRCMLYKVFGVSSCGNKAH
jgi:hypothetical protein